MTEPVRHVEDPEGDGEVGQRSRVATTGEHRRSRVGNGVAAYRTGQRDSADRGEWRRTAAPPRTTTNADGTSCLARTCAGVLLHDANLPVAVLVVLLP